MRKLYIGTLFVFIFLISNLKGWGQATIAFNGAESSGTTWTTSSNSFTASTTNTGTPADRIKSGTQSWQKATSGGTLVTNGVSTSGYTSCFVEVWNASISASAGNGIDNGEFIKVYASNTSTFGATPDITVISAAANARWGMSGTGVVTTTAGTAVTQSLAAGGTLTGASAYSKLVINIPSGWTNVYLKIETSNNDANEIWCIDDIALKGTSCTTPTLTGASQAAAVCGGVGATINLTGMVASTTGNAIDYTINGVAQTQITGVSTNASGQASFTSAALTNANNGQTLQITKVTNSTCNANFTQNVTLAVNPTPTVTFTAQPGATACANTNVTYTTQSGGGESNYIWTFPGSNGVDYSIISGGTTSDATVTLQYLTGGSKTVTVKYTKSGCTPVTATSSTATTVTLPAPTFTTQPGTGACISTNLTYTTQASQSSYAWTFPGSLGVDYSIISGGSSSDNTVTVQYLTTGSKTVTVNYTTSGGCTAASATSSTATTISNVPATPSGITGSSNVCQSETGVTYNVTNVGGITYNWTYSGTGATITGGTTSAISINYSAAATSGNLQVTAAVSGCVNTTPSTLAVSVNTPAQPSIITGTSSLSAPQTGVSYSVTNVSGVSYAWVYSGTNVSIASGAGTNAITLDFASNATSGTLTVTPSVLGCNGTARTYSISVIPVNDNCAGAISITPSSNLICSSPTSGTIFNATQTIAPVSASGSTSASTIADVWYSFVATGTTHIVEATPSATFDMVIDVRSGACDGTSIASIDDYIEGNFESKIVTGLTPGATYYIRLYHYKSAAGDPAIPADPTFTVCVLTPCLAYDFTSTTMPPTSWAGSNVTRSTTAADYMSYPAGATFASSTGSLTTPMLSNPSSISFYLGRTTNTNPKSMYVNVSTVSQTGPFTTIAIYDNGNVPSDSYDQYTVNLGAYESYPQVWIQFQKVSSTTSPWRLDDIQVACGSSCTQPTITTQPVDASNCINTSIGLSAAASSGSATYQWEMLSTNAVGYIWTNVANATPTGVTYTGATTGSLSITGTSAVSAYFYRCKITLGGCSIYTNTAQVTILGNPTITTDPTNQTIQINSGTNRNFSVATTNATTFQWQSDNGTGSTWTDVANAAPYSNVTTATMTVNAATTVIGMDGYQYRCIVGNGYCSDITSGTATLTVINQAPNNPTIGSTCSGASVFSVGNTKADIAWTAPATGITPDGYLVFVTAGGTAPTGTLLDASTYTANSIYSSATTASPASLGKCVYKGTGTTFQLTGLTAGSTYSFKVYAYKGTSNTGWSSGAAAATKSSVTFTIPNATSFAATTASGQSVLSWSTPANTSPNCRDEVMVVVNQGSVTLTPTGDGTSYTAAALYAGGVNQVVYKGTGSGVTVTGLQNGTNYCFKIFTREGDEWSSGSEVCVMPGIPIPDNACDAASFGTATYNVATNLLITKVTVGVKISHTYRGDMILRLLSPTGTEITIHNSVGGSADNLDAVYDDAGVGSAATGNHTIDGTYDITCAVQGLLTQPLSTFNGELSAGNWQLKVCDDAGTDVGYIHNFVVNITGTVPCTPTIGSTITFAPTSGPAGTLVTITGTGFTGATSVKFGTVNAATYTVVNSTTIIAEVPTNVPTSSTVNISDAALCERKSSGSFTGIITSGLCAGASGGGSGTELFISEVYDASTGDNQFIEIFNPTGSSIALSGYSLRVTAYGSKGGTNTTNISFTGGATIASGGLYIVMIGNSATTCGSVSHNQSNTSGGFNGNDEVFLLKAGSVIDNVPNPPSLSGAGFSQIRKSSVTAPATSYAASEWDVYSTESCADLGVAPYSVGTPLTIDSDPADVSSCAVTMAVTVTPTSGTTFQWKYNNGTNGVGWTDLTNGTVALPGATIAGATTSSLSITGDMTLYNNYQFYCLVTNSTCNKASKAAQFTVNAQRYFKSVTPVTGDWTTANNWLMSTTAGGTYTSACTYPTASNSDSISIESGSVLNLNVSTITLDQLVIQSGGTVTIPTTTTLTINNTTAGADFRILGTLIDNSNSSNNVVFNSGATWEIGSAGSLIRTNNSSSNVYQSNYEGGIATIPATANWILRYSGASANISLSTIGAYYPNLILESNSGVWSPSSFCKFTGSTGFATIKGNFDIGGTGSGTVNGFINENTNAQPLLIQGNMIVRNGSSITNVGATNGTGFEVLGDVTIDGTITNTGGATAILRLTGTATSPQSISGAGTMTVKNVSVNKTGVGGGVVLNRDMAIPSGGTLTISNGLVNAQTQTLNGAGNLTMTGGTLQLSKNAVTQPELTGTYSLNGGTVIMNGNGTAANAQTIRAVNYYNLTSTSTGDRILASSGTIGVANVFTPNYPTQKYTIGGSTVDFNGASNNQDVPAFAFYNVGFKNGGTKTLVGSDTVYKALTIGNVPTINDNTIVALGNYDITLKSNNDNTANVTQTAAPLANVTYGTGRFIVERYLPMRNAATGRRWRLMGIPISATNAPTINEAWQEGATPTPSTYSATGSVSIYNPNPKFGTHITNGFGSINNASGFDAGSTNSPSIYKMEPGSGSWTIPNNTNSINITNYSAYMLFVRGDRSIIVSSQYINTTDSANLRIRGKINIGSVSKSLVSGKQVIGNPYPSAISLNSTTYAGSPFGTATGRTYYMWDPLLLGSKKVGSWATFTSNGNNTYTVVPNPIDSSHMTDFGNTGKIESGGAFLFDASVSGTLTFSESNKLSTSSTKGLASRGATQGRPQYTVAELYTNLAFRDGADNPVLADGVATVYADEFNNEVDEQDAAKLQTFQTKEKISLLRSNKVLAVERRKTITETDTIYLQMDKLDANYKYQLQFKANDFAPTLQAFLKDNYLNTVSTVSTEGVTRYNFTTNSNPSSFDINRFVVVFMLREGGVLPVRFISIQAATIPNSNAVSVNWKVADETNHKEYIIEKSTDGINFEKVGVVASSNALTYQWVDLNATSGFNYYRIISVSNNAATEYSKMVYVNRNEVNKPSINLYSNPVKDGTIALQISNTEASRYDINLFNSLGQLMVKKLYQHAGGIGVITIGENVARGMYHLSITDMYNRKETIKVIVE